MPDTKTLPEMPPGYPIQWTPNPDGPTDVVYGFDEVRALQIATWNAAMEAAAKEAEERSANVQKANTYRGRVNAAAMFAADQLEFFASAIRALKEPQ